jgi:hypothetical protein
MGGDGPGVRLLSFANCCGSEEFEASTSAGLLLLSYISPFIAAIQ